MPEVRLAVLLASWEVGAMFGASPPYSEGRDLEMQGFKMLPCKWIITHTRLVSYSSGGKVTPGVVGGQCMRPCA